MQDFVTLWRELFSIASDFLLAPPIIWFVGIMILILIAGFMRKIIK